MYQIGKTYKDREGNTHKVIRHARKTAFPIITTDQKGVLHAFTNDGNYHRNKESEKDLTGG